MITLSCFAMGYPKNEIPKAFKNMPDVFASVLRFISHIRLKSLIFKMHLFVFFYLNLIFSLIYETYSFRSLSVGLGVPRAGTPNSNDQVCFDERNPKSTKSYFFPGKTGEGRICILQFTVLYLCQNAQSMQMFCPGSTAKKSRLFRHPEFANRTVVCSYVIVFFCRR